MRYAVVGSKLCGGDDDGGADYDGGD